MVSWLHLLAAVPHGVNVANALAAVMHCFSTHVRLTHSAEPECCHLRGAPIPTLLPIRRYLATSARLSFTAEPQG
jgi:hypothetical protein